MFQFFICKDYYNYQIRSHIPVEIFFGLFRTPLLVFIHYYKYSLLLRPCNSNFIGLAALTAQSNQYYTKVKRKAHIVD